MTRKLAFAVAAAVLAFASCGDDCDKCTTASECPRITKQCSGYTATIQQCSGAQGEDMCCATSASEVSCSSFRHAEGTYAYSPDTGTVHFREADTECGLQVWIDAVANGWVADPARTPASEAAIRARMRQVLPLARPR
jgi:hypothetical protein